MIEKRLGSMSFVVGRRDVMRENGLSRRANRPTALCFRELSAKRNNRTRLQGEFRLGSLAMFSLLCRNRLNGECPLTLVQCCFFSVSGPSWGTVL